MKLKPNSPIGQLLQRARQSYYRLPGFVQLTIRTASNLRWAFSALRVELWLITRKGEAQQEGLKIYYSGSEKTRQLISRLAFDDDCEASFISKTWLWRASRTLSRCEDEDLLSVIEMPFFMSRVFKKEQRFFIPNWIHADVDISIEMNRLLKNSSLQSDLRRIRKNNLTFEVVNDVQHLQEFYSNMYVPLITQSHGSEAIIDPYLTMEREFLNGADLLLVAKDGKHLGGMLIIYPSSTAYLWRIGILNGDVQFIQEGAISALYYYSILFLREKGYRRVHFGMTRAFLKDGVLQYKRKWGLTLVGKPNMGILIGMNPRGQQARQFLLDNPFIFMQNKKFYSGLFTEKPLLDEDDFQQFNKEYYYDGIETMVIHRFDVENPQVGCSIPEELVARVRLVSIKCGD